MVHVVACVGKSIGLSLPASEEEEGRGGEGRGGSRIHSMCV